MEGMMHQEEAEGNQGGECDERLQILREALESAARPVGCACPLCRGMPLASALGLALGGGAVAFAATSEPSASAAPFFAGLLGFAAVLGGALLAALHGQREARRLARLRGCAEAVAEHLHNAVLLREWQVRELSSHVEQHHAQLLEMSAALAEKLGGAWRPARRPDSDN